LLVVGGMQTKLTKLRDLIRTATAFSSIWDYFHGHCVPDARFMARSQPRRSPTLDELVASIAAQLATARTIATGGSAAPPPIVSQYLCIDQLWHGAGVAAGRSFLALWDERGGVGLVSFVPAAGADQTMQYARFHCVPLPGGAVLGKAARA
jgi:hypothetical protein